jgi:hypothetical protein
MSIDCFCDYEPATVYKRRNVQAARKQHKCDECGRTIMAGEPYEYTFGIWDDFSDNYYTCQHCLELRDWGTISFECFCWAHGSMLDDLHELMQEESYKVPGLFMEYGRRKIRARRYRKEHGL